MKPEFPIEIGHDIPEGISQEFGQQPSKKVDEVAQNETREHNKESSPEALAEMFEKKQKDILRARVERWALSEFVRRFYGEVVLQEFSPEKIQQVLEELSQEHRPDQPSITNILPLDFIHRLHDGDALKAVAFFEKAASFYEKEDKTWHERSFSKKMTENFYIEGHNYWFRRDASRSAAERMRIQATAERIGLGNIAKKRRLRDNYDRIAQHALSEMRIFDSSKKNEPPNFQAFTKRMEELSFSNTDELFTKLNERINAHITEAKVIHEEFQHGLEIAERTVAEDVEKLFGPKREALLKKIEIQQTFVDEHLEHPEAKRAFQTEIEMVIKEYEELRAQEQTKRELLLKPWHDARDKIKTWNHYGENARI